MRSPIFLLLFIKHLISPSLRVSPRQRFRWNSISIHVHFHNSIKSSWIQRRNLDILFSRKMTLSRKCISDIFALDIWRGDRFEARACIPFLSQLFISLNICRVWKHVIGRQSFKDVIYYASTSSMTHFVSNGDR